MSTGPCGTPCAPSTTVRTPAARARAAISATGLIVPSTLEMCAKATTFTSPRGSSAARWSGGGGAAGGAPPPARGGAVVVDLQVAQGRARLAAEQLPRHEVGVVLHLGDEHHVARSDVVAAP